jgi:DNA-binding response OmpR family regulator
MASPVLTALGSRRPTPARPVRPVALVIEDAEEYVVLARRILEADGYDVHRAATGEGGLDAARVRDYDVVLIDVTLPGMDGFEVCRRLRAASDVHIVMVTAHDSEIEKVIGFRLGADDYVTKPFSPVELAARIAAVRRRPRGPRLVEVRTAGPVEVDVAAREVRVEGTPVPLTRIEFDLVSALAGAPRRVFTRAELHDTVWGHGYGDLRVVDVHIGNLRRKLRAVPGAPDPIATVRGVGYRMAVAG